MSAIDPALPDVTHARTPVRLHRAETWITKPDQSADGWATVKPFLFVCLTTRDGVSGWGEAFTLPLRAPGMAAIIHALFDAAVSLEDATPQAFRALAGRIANKHRGMDFAAATSAIEMALWDIQGQIANRPLRALLAEQYAESIPVYANTWSTTEPDIPTLAARAGALVEQGFEAVKFYPLQNRSPEQGGACMAAMRDTVGDSTALMLDLGSPDDPALARGLAPLVAPYDPYWFEEPVDGEDTRELAAIRRDTGLRVVTGEKQCGLPHFRETLAAEAADVLNPDIAGVGGILDMLQIAHLAAETGVAVSPHCWNSMTVAAAAMMQVCAVLPNSERAEVYPEYLPHGALYADTGFALTGGTATLIDRPGLGVVMDKAALAAISTYQQESTAT